jgi:hypothetical protein
MTTLELCLTAAAAPQLLIALANLFAPRMLRYGDNLARVSPIIRQIFIVHGVYIVLIVLGAAALCLAHPHELAGASALGRSLSAFLALFWGLRVLIQLCYYDPAARRAHPAFNLLFLAAFGYLAAVFATAALFGAGPSWP